ncbi:ABC transporter permease subunit [Solibacillus sp.]|uniref:ABC transporter permease subunit n=1 Tax=Solibacillus sp. TaxID=1909654 RepID=UPI003314A7F7
MLGLGGGFFAALLGISALADEEKNRTAEFLLTHPISRRPLLHFGSTLWADSIVKQFLHTIIIFLLIFY